MIKNVLITSILAGPVFAGAAYAGEVAERCDAIVTEMGAEDANGGCVCFEDSISEEEQEIYLSLESEDDWNARATDDMKEAIAACFPAP